MRSWRPDHLVVRKWGREFLVTDAYIAARVREFEFPGVEGPGVYKRVERGQYELVPPSDRRAPNAGREHRTCDEMATESGAEAWPLGIQDDESLSLPWLYGGKNARLWLWGNEHGDVLAFNAALHHHLSKLCNLSPEKSYLWTCEGVQHPLFIWDVERQTPKWLGAIMPVLLHDLSEIQSSIGAVSPRPVPAQGEAS